MATYRLQLHRSFTFDDARSVVGYLHDLGVTDVYASPILKARAGSEHGYDVVDPTRLNPELGGDGAFDELATSLTSRGMGLIVDIVPNHMAISPENTAWMDVLEHGPTSPFADWFDIHWGSRDGNGAAEQGLLLPILGDELEAVIATGDFMLKFDGRAFVLRYFDWVFPVETGSVGMVLRMAAEACGDAAPVLARLAKGLDELEDWRSTPHDRAALRRRNADDLKRRVRSVIASDAAARRAVEGAIQQINNNSRSYPSGGPLSKLIAQQVYRPCHWKQASRKLSYRRFFDITHLIGVRVEDERVFFATHKLILRLVHLGAITGLRIDHIDGLADPLGYLRRLDETLQRARPPATADAGNGRRRPPCILVEKILEGTEPLDANWPVSGTTGYDFLNAINGIFVDPAGLKHLAAYQAELSGLSISFHQQVREQKRRMARELFGGEVDALVDELVRVACDSGEEGVAKPEELAAAIIDLSAELPVYRTYGRDSDMTPRDYELIEDCIASLPPSPAMRLLRRVLIGDDMPHSRSRMCFITRWQQFTGPLMAKGLEDTMLYRDARLISMNEVGLDPDDLDQPRGVDGFHAHNIDRAKHWPHTMTTTSTHDTKRSEDVRCRIHVLSEIAQQWIETSRRWIKLNAALKPSHKGEPSPDTVFELFVYQSALGAWPLHGHEERSFIERLAEYVVKAARERKMHTGWLESDEAYEESLVQFVKRVFDKSNREFLAEFRDLHCRLAWYGAMNSLSQTVLRMAAPGVPDVYQGNELWDFSLVDPDNRRPVDYALRRRLLDELPKQALKGEQAAELLESWRDGRIKLHVTRCALHARRRHPSVFLNGDYTPLQATNNAKQHICAFARHHEGTWAIAVAPLRVADMVKVEQPPLSVVWGDSSVALPDEAPTRWRNVLTGEAVDTPSRSLRLAPAFSMLPVALLTHA